MNKGSVKLKRHYHMTETSLVTTSESKDGDGCSSADTQEKFSFPFNIFTTQMCNVSYLRYGSFPVINPDNSTFPDKFVLNQLFQYSVTMETNKISTFLNISTPWPGDWFAAAFINDSSQQIKQKGLYRPCQAWLASLLRVNIENSVINVVSNEELYQEISKPTFYKFYAGFNTWSTSIVIKDCSSSLDNCPVMLLARPFALPSAENTTLNSFSVNCSTVKLCSANIIPAEENFNYILVHPLFNETVNFTLEVALTACESRLLKEISDVASELAPTTELPEENKTIFSSFNHSNILYEPHYFFYEHNKAQEFLLSCWPQVTLTRETEPNHFSFQYVVLYNDNLSYFMNVSTFIPTFTKFPIETVIDIGGTLAIEVIFPSMNQNMTTNMTIEICIQFGIRPIFNENGSCLSAMSLQVNTSSRDNRIATMLIPFPEIGTWYISLFPRCYVQDDDFNSTVVPCDNSNVSVFLNIKSTPCNLNECGKHGNCHIYSSGGLIYSSCHCVAGWRGWGCTDGTKAFSNADLLVSVLLLTLSNIFFLPVIVLALYRHYFTEASIYATSMLFSTFYHACDSEIYSFCLMRLSVLQFCDFYSAILSIWVTLIAMAKLSPTLQSLCHMLGAVGLALGVEYDRTGLLVFIIPAGTGLVIIIISWIWQCHQQHACYPRKRIWFLCLLPGILLAVSGLIMFAFFETEENYAYVHSAWHATMALSALFLLPERRNHKGREEAINTCSYVRVEELSDISPTQEYGVYEHLLPPSP
ncbi:transmembrane protein 8B-like isoform X3 [Centruroides vittatus]|uniref:transmembrane protein 8B-like isoform X3 n=1 Tax=Centruroides vittatus TaxID=120091 RepID=UPI00350F3D6E